MKFEHFTIFETMNIYATLLPIPQTAYKTTTLHIDWTYLPQTMGIIDII